VRERKKEINRERERKTMSKKKEENDDVGKKNGEDEKEEDDEYRKTKMTSRMMAVMKTPSQRLASR
jgi:hypothetical protein